LSDLGCGLHERALLSIACRPRAGDDRIRARGGRMCCGFSATKARSRPTESRAAREAVETLAKRGLRFDMHAWLSSSFALV
jgi:hypothetical protein